MAEANDVLHGEEVEVKDVLLLLHLSYIIRSSVAAFALRRLFGFAKESDFELLLGVPIALHLVSDCLELLKPLQLALLRDIGIEELFVLAQQLFARRL